MTSPTGDQYELALTSEGAHARAVITQLAAGIREYSINGIDLVEPFRVTDSPPMGAGIVLAPWPNRVRDGVWEHAGETQQLALTEPARHNAIHGLLRFTPYRELERGVEALRLGATVYPQPGYRFLLDTEVEYRLAADGLEVTHRIRNAGDGAAPVALGAHPYLRLGETPVDELVLRLSAATHIDVDERLNPVGESPVDDTEYDLRGGVPVGRLRLDDGFGGSLVVDGVVEHSLTAPDGRSVSVWGDEQFRYVQVFTPRSFPGGTAHDDSGTRLAVAVEPMTAPADALNSGAGLRWVQPGETWTARWGIRHRGIV
ncbi:aldose 1-epimerase family protein [Luethyella okanaganae]|uniref:Aldose 1-epimerase family protein n=1 Tax=Luethyella okanaganae TaxID=69372 RepID=A0ABW1VGG7_9MICO